MAIVSSYGALTALATPAASLTTVSTSGPFYDGYRRDYAAIYRTQPEVRIVVDFIARNVAQLGLHVFRRVSDTDRMRLTDHGLARLIRRPNPSTSRYRLIESTLQDFGIFWNAYWLKVRQPGRLGVIRVPAAEMSVKGGVMPTEYVWQPDGVPVPDGGRTFAPSEIVHFRGYDPNSGVVGMPPIETLRRVLAEREAWSQYREQLWKNQARTETVITRPKDAPKAWDKEGFRQQWQEFAGNGARAGKTPVLEDGMDIKAIGTTSRDSQWLEGAKLSREVVAAAYHIPQHCVGILDHATFSNIREQHKELYQDALGPTLIMLEEDVELQLLPEFGDSEDLCVEFNLAEKLKGSFEEQADSLQRAIGRPWMTPNEGRARVNLPKDQDPESDRIATTAPGQAAPVPRPTNADAVRPILARFFARQQARVEKDAEPVYAFDQGRWTRELAADLRPVLGEAAGQVAQDINRGTLTALQDGRDPWTAARVEHVVAQLRES